MSTTESTGELFPEIERPAGVVTVNERCILRTREGFRLVIVNGMVVSQYSVDDRMAEAFAMVNLVEQGWADQNDVARAFDCSSRTVRRHQDRYASGGLAALGRTSGFPKGRTRVSLSVARQLNRLKAKGWSNRRMAEHLGLCEKAVRKRLRRLGWKSPLPLDPLLPFEEPPPTPPSFGPHAADPNLSAFSSPPEEAQGSPAPAAADPNLSAFGEMELPFSLDTDPTHRSIDRVLACMGWLDDAAPLFQSAQRVSGAGVLLALPALLSSGVLDCARNTFGSIGPAFFGLRTTVMSLLLMALLRIRRPENLKEHPPQDLGRILGLDRAPEVKTLRRKLAHLAARGQAVPFGRALAQHRAAARGKAMGFLYVDGHVRVYHGQHAIPKAHVARMRLSMPATTDYWVNDIHGEPLFVVTAEANAGLVKMLPALMAEIRPLVGERRLTIVFDRGGWSPKLFVDMLAAGFDILTYRKGHSPRIPKTHFRVHTGQIEGQSVSYRLADQGVCLLKGRLRLRQVTRLSDDGHQTPIVTSRRDLSALEVAHRMFERWQQENFFKYLREEYALDALLEYNAEPDRPDRDVPNPEWQALDARLHAERAILETLKAQYGAAAFNNAETRRRTMRGFKIAHAPLTRQLRQAQVRCDQLEKQRSSLPRRVPVAQATHGEVVRLAAEQKHLSSLFKMVAYQAESDLVRLIQPHYRRAEDEGRTLVQFILASSADLELSSTELTVRVMPLSSAHRTRVLAALCEELNTVPTTFPGTKLRLHFDLAIPKNTPKADKS